LFLIPKNVKFIKSIFTYSKVTTSKKQFCFLGRSNVGKSSLINFLFNHKKLAYTGKKPGKTIALNLFEFTLGNQNYQFVDTPGYGYHLNSKIEAKRFQNLMNDYLNKQANLQFFILLLDIRRTDSKNDKIMLDFLNKTQKPILIFFTKIDKLSKTKINLNLKLIKNFLNLDSKIEFVLTSSLKKINRQVCLNLIAKNLLKN